MREHSITRGQRWQLDFAAAGAPVFLDLVSVERGFAAHVLSGPDVDRGPPVFVIDADGPDLPETGIPGALAVQYFYALDVALTAQGSAASSSEGPP